MTQHHILVISQVKQAPNIETNDSYKDSYYHCTHAFVDMTQENLV